MDSVPLCLACGLCCDGSLFSDVRLSGEDVVRLGLEGAAVTLTRKRASGSAFPQPCGAFRDCHCSIYDFRPNHCRNFDCALLRRNAAGEVSYDQAIRIVKRCRAQAGKVRKLLLKLGETRGELSLQKRFRRAEKIAHGCTDPELHAIYGELTLAMHKLQCLLATEIYPE